jgi:hypothetical protein
MSCAAVNALTGNRSGTKPLHIDSRLSTKAPRAVAGLGWGNARHQCTPGATALTLSAINRHSIEICNQRPLCRLPGPDRPRHAPVL